MSSSLSSQSFMATAKSTLSTITTFFPKLKEEEEKSSLPIDDELTMLINLAISIQRYAPKAESCQAECNELAIQTSELTKHIVSVNRFVKTTTQSVYERPIRRISADIARRLERALTLVKNCQSNKTNILLRYVFAITPGDFKKVKDLIGSSIGDMMWVISRFQSDADIAPSLLPIANTNPTLAYVWCFIFYIHSGSLWYRNDAVKGLNELLLLNDRNKEIIVEENGVPPLLNLLKENGDPDVQVVSVTALYNLADKLERVRLIAKEPGVSIIVDALYSAPSHRVQLELVRLVSRMVELDDDVKEEFARKNVIRPLVKLLGIYVVLEGGVEFEVPNKDPKLNTIARVNQEMTKKGRQGSSGNHGNKEEKEEEIESPEEKLKLKVYCVNALWKLAKGSLLNSRQIAESMALHYLSRIMEKDKGELKVKCLNTVMELAAVAEDNHELRIALKLNALASKAVLNQLLRILIEDDSVTLLVPAIKSIGSLSRTFSAKETRIVQLLVMLLDRRNHIVAKQAVIALAKFVEPHNFNCVDYSNAVLEFHGLPKLMNRLILDEGNQFDEVLLLCYLTVHVGSNKAFDHARAKTVLEGAVHYFSTRSYYRNLFAQAINSLALYQAGALMHKTGYTFMVEI